MNGSIPESVQVVMRRFLLALLVLGLVGTATELLLLDHYEDSWQVVPLALIVTALLAIGGVVVGPSAGTIKIFRVVMGLLIVAGGTGVILHYLGSLEFQVDMDPSLSQWELFKKVIRAKAPPALAPGVMAQLGLLGLVFTYKHPALGRTGSSEEFES